MEMLSVNLYSFLKGQNYEGMEIEVIRKILIQILQALTFLHHVILNNHIERHYSLRHQTLEHCL